jgi:hypothetical protein
MKINTTNYEEFFLLYVDNELSANEKATLDTFIQENPSYQKALALLQQSVLTPELIEYKDKALLYRFNEMEASLPNAFKQNLYRTQAPIVKGFFTMGRMLAMSSAAAILILIIGYRFVINAPDNHSTSIASTTINVASATKAPIVSTISTNASSIKQTSSLVIQNIRESSKGQQDFIKEDGIKIVATADAIVLANTSQVITSPIVRIEKQELPTPVQNANKPTERFEEVNTDNPDRIIYVANLEIDGDKLRGFTRRVNAIFRRNKTEKEK